MGKQRSHLYDALTPMGKRKAQIPRLGRLLAMLPADQLASIVTDADLLWQAYTYESNDPALDSGLLAEGLKAQKARRLAWRPDSEPPLSFRPNQVRRAADILGALAFEMLAQVNANGNPDPAWNGIGLQQNITKIINGKRTTKRFVDWVQDRFVTAGALVTRRGQPEHEDLFFDDWDALLHMDSHGLKHFIFSTDARDELLRWTDVTTLAFFAAYWACRWATPEEVRITERWIIDPLNKTNEVFHEFWLFAATMPDEALNHDLTGFQQLFASLYGTLVKDAQGYPVRSTEFIYRTWDRMEGSAAKVAFLQEIHLIRKGDFGMDKKQVADIMLTDDEEKQTGFITLECKPVGSRLPHDTGTFEMGAHKDEYPLLDTSNGIQDNPLHTVRLSSYRLHRYCVTNVEYELFNPAHVARRSFGDTTGQGDRCPAVNVSWYDAFCFAAWCSCTLPTEAQWEYACRAGYHGERYSVFTFAEGANEIFPDAKNCNYDGNYPFPHRKATNGNYRQRTIDVDALAANAWGFYQMHGNAWEWCTDWYLPEFYTTKEGVMLDPANTKETSDRVLRGGSWISHGRYCRSAHRYWFAPEYRHDHCGFRLAAVPLREVKQEQVKS